MCDGSIVHLRTTWWTSTPRCSPPAPSPSRIPATCGGNSSLPPRTAISLRPSILTAHPHRIPAAPPPPRAAEAKQLSPSRNSSRSDRSGSSQHRREDVAEARPARSTNQPHLSSLSESPSPLPSSYVRDIDEVAEDKDSRSRAPQRRCVQGEWRGVWRRVESVPVLSAHTLVPCAAVAGPDTPTSEL